MQLKKLTWNNMFSYGNNNCIDFLTNKVTLIEGKIGAGKSSIPTILEELLYNKNSRDFKKTEITNNTIESKGYSGTVEFNIGTDEYKLTKDVKSTAKVVLLKNGIDISAHTASGTYKLLEEIIGLDFTTFSKLVYQSVKSQMDFLSATDAKRKEFLVGLMNLGIYKEIEDDIKADKKVLDTELAIIDGVVKVLDSQVKSFKDKELLENKPIPAFDIESHKDTIKKLQEKSTNINIENALIEHSQQVFNRDKLLLEQGIAAINSKIKNITQLMHNCEKELQQEELPKPLPFDSNELQSVTRELTRIQTLMEEAKKRYNHFRQDASKTSCHVCGSNLDKQTSYNAALAAKEEYELLKPDVQKLLESKTALDLLQQENLQYNKWFNKRKNLEQSIIELISDNEMLEEQLISDNEKLKNLKLDIKHKTNNNELELEIKELQKKLKVAEEEIRTLELYNASVEPTNSAILSNRENHYKATEDLKIQVEKQLSIFKELKDLEVLQKSVKDLVSYRIENEIKVFESLINSYLAELSGGKFALTFELTEAKLCVIIYNNGIVTSINTLSSGESTLVNLSVLFAIREVLAATCELNLVFLDEIISVLGVEDKDNLIDVLLKQRFNTLLVSHGYNNPLCSKIIIEKNNKGISEICQ